MMEDLGFFGPMVERMLKSVLAVSNENGGLSPACAVTIPRMNPPF
jgi:hypothetical protein